MSQKSQPRFRVMRRLESGDYLALAVWPGKANPEDEVIRVQLRRQEGEWKNVGRLAVYRTKDGGYSELPESRGAEKQA
jgi:hypothetical protein